MTRELIFFIGFGVIALLGAVTYSAFMTKAIYKEQQGKSAGWNYAYAGLVLLYTFCGILCWNIISFNCSFFGYFS